MAVATGDQVGAVGTSTKGRGVLGGAEGVPGIAAICAVGWVGSWWWGTPQALANKTTVGEMRGVVLAVRVASHGGDDGDDSQSRRTRQ